MAWDMMKQNYMKGRYTDCVIVAADGREFKVHIFQFKTCFSHRIFRGKYTRLDALRIELAESGDVVERVRHNCLASLLLYFFQLFS